jgi:membrane associated rhomboid family serine protease
MAFFPVASEHVSGLNGPSAAGGVAFWAHIGGFITGLVLALLVRPGQRDRLSAY